MSINTVIFDLDGTLLNTLDDLQASFNYALKTCGYPEHSLEEVKGFVGNGIKTAFERAIGSNFEDREINKLVEIFKTYYTENMYNLTAPYSGIIEMLRELKEKKYKMAVVSNKYDAASKELCKKYFSEYINVAIGESARIRKKPACDGVLKAIGELGSGLPEVIYVGDSEVDIKTAINANIPCISVLWGFKSRDFLEKQGGRLFAEQPKDIIKIIEKNLYLV